MEVEGAVERGKVPRNRDNNVVKGQWTGLAARAVHECEHGRVLVVVFDNGEELKKFRHGSQTWLKKAGWSMRTVVLPADDGKLRVYFPLEKFEPPAAPISNGVVRRRR